AIWGDSKVAATLTNPYLGPDRIVSCWRSLSFWMSSPLHAASSASGAVFSAMHRVLGGHPHTRPRASQTTHFLFGPRYPGPPRSPQVASAKEVAATRATRAAINLRQKLLGDISSGPVYMIAQQFNAVHPWLRVELCGASNKPTCVGTFLLG